MDDSSKISASGIERAKALVGGNTALAALLSERGSSITSQAVSQWRRVPAERVIEVERVTGVSRSELRPDLYPPGDADYPRAPAPEATGA